MQRFLFNLAESAEPGRRCIFLVHETMQRYKTSLISKIPVFRILIASRLFIAGSMVLSLLLYGCSESEPVQTSDVQQAAARSADYLINNSIFFCFISRHKEVPIRVRLNFFQGPARVGCKYCVQCFLHPQYLPCVNLYIGCLALKSSHWLVEHDS